VDNKESLAEKIARIAEESEATKDAPTPEPLPDHVTVYRGDKVIVQAKSPLLGQFKPASIDPKAAKAAITEFDLERNADYY